MEIFITSTDQISQYNGQLVTVTGIYRQLNVHQKEGRTSFVGRAEIILPDGFIALEAGDAGIRPQAEIEKFEYKQVVVTGTLYNSFPLWGDGTQACIVAPCLTGVSNLRLVNA